MTSATHPIVGALKDGAYSPDQPYWEGVLILAGYFLPVFEEIKKAYSADTAFTALQMATVMQAQPFVALYPDARHRIAISTDMVADAYDYLTRPAAKN